MGIFDFFKKDEEHRSDKENTMDSKQGRAAQNPVSRRRDEEQLKSDTVSSPNSSKSFKPNDRPPAPSHEYYEVREGDTLSGIAEEHYGDSSKWQMIYEKNKGTIKNPDLIQPGQVLELPNMQHKNK